jgi:hypothetical protein
MKDKKSPIAKNYDYGEPGLGTGLYRGPMNRFKSVTDFLKKKRKKKRKNVVASKNLELLNSCNYFYKAVIDNKDHHG